VTVAGIGVDVVDLARFAETLQRTPGLHDRLFTAAERNAAPQTLAATFAAKEAVAKALGVPGDLSWQDVEVTRDERGRPALTVADSRWSELRWHLSLSHDGGVAVAMVVAER
jgi:holo-[acyl-carrier protein] synthase